MLVEFLSDQEAARFGRYEGPPSRAELERAFFLDDADRALVGRRRGDQNHLGFALQLTTARYLASSWPTRPSCGTRSSFHNPVLLLAPDAVRQLGNYERGGLAPLDRLPSNPRMSQES